MTNTEQYQGQHAARLRERAEQTEAFRKLRATPLPSNLTPAQLRKLALEGWQTKLGHASNRLRNAPGSVYAGKVLSAEEYDHINRHARAEVRAWLGAEEE